MDFSESSDCYRSMVRFSTFLLSSVVLRFDFSLSLPVAELLPTLTLHYQLSGEFHLQWLSGRKVAKS